MFHLRAFRNYCARMFAQSPPSPGLVQTGGRADARVSHSRHGERGRRSYPALTIGQRGSASRRYNSGQRRQNERSISMKRRCAPRPPVSDVTLAEAPRSTSAVPAVTPVQAPRSASPTPVPRRARLPGVPAGYPDFQVLARGDTKIEVQCPSCGCVFRRLNSLMGKLEKCPDCRTVMRIPT